MKNSDSYWTRLWFQMWNDCSTFSEICDWEENILALNLFVAYYAFLFNKIFKGVPKLIVTFKQTQTIQILFFHVVHDDDSRFGFVSVQEPVKGFFVLPLTVFPAFFFLFCFNLVMNGLSSCIEDWCHILALVIVCLLKTWEKFCSHPGQNWWTKQLFVVFHNSCIVQ